jgi:xanthine/CO dehydrogenase XdhC/CoxF family maturation factor
VSAPAGFDLGARNLEEIALSLVCELVMQRRGGSGLLLLRDKISQQEGANQSA